MALILTRSQVNSVISMKDCIYAVENAFKEFALGTARVPSRVTMTPTDGNWFAVMPAYLARQGALATKIVSVYPRNQAEAGLPNVLATIILNDPETGQVAAILEGSYITAMRTGAVSGVATKHLARSNSKTLGIFGAGVQARKQLEAVSEVRSIEKVIVYDKDRSKALSFISDEKGKSNSEISLGNSAREVVRAADIIVTATTSPSPVLNGQDIRPGTHINAIGAYAPETRELDDATITNSKIVVDSMNAALSEAGDIIIPLRDGVIHPEDIWAELGEIVTGKKPGRTSNEEKTFFKSVGLGIQDAAVAMLVFKKAQSLGLGTNFDLEN